MQYTVTRNGQLIGNARSIIGAIKIAEQSFQCGISQSKSEVENGLKVLNFKTVSHCLDNSLLIKIEAA